MKQERIDQQGTLKGDGWIRVAIVFPWYSRYPINIVSLNIYAASIYHAS